MSPPPPTIASINPAAKAAAQSKNNMFPLISIIQQVENLSSFSKIVPFLNYTIIDELLNQKYILT
jgi:hypothetical protein